MRLLASYVMRGRFQAMAVTAVVAVLSLLVPPAALVSSAALALVTLRRGEREGMLVLAGATLAVAALSAFLVKTLSPAISFVVLLGLPVLLVASVLRRTISLAYATEAAAVISFLGVLVVYGIFGDPAAQWRSLLEEPITSFVQQGGWQGSEQELEQLLDSVSRLMTGAFAAGVTLGTLLGILLGRWWQALLYNPGGFGEEFRALRLHLLSAYVALGALAVAAMMGLQAGIATDLVLIAAVGYLIQGLAVVHGLVKMMGGHVAWLVAMYAMLVLVLPQMVMLLAGLGYADAWFDLRRRAQRARGGGPQA
jgi:hypothetical protein